VSEGLKILYAVQQADLELARLQEALAGLDTGEELAAEAAGAEAELEELRRQHRASEKDHTDRELELETLEEKRARFQAQLYGGTVRNPRQLEDLQNEVAMLSREKGKVEDRLLELMESLELERSQIGAASAHLKELQERLAAVRAKHETTGARLRQEIADLEAEREARAAGVDRQLLRRYEQIRARQGNLGLVRITGNTCPGCHITFPSEVLKSIKAGRPDLTCESCGRLLYWDESEA